MGYDSTGEQIRRRKTWAPEPGLTTKQIEKELNRQAILFEEQCRTGQFLNGSVTFSDFVDVWMRDYARPNLKPTTIDGYKMLLNRIIPAIGHIKLCKLQPQHLLSFYANLGEGGIRGDIRYCCTLDFKQYVKDRGYTQAKAANLSGVPLPTFTNACAGKFVSEKTARQLNAFFKEDIFLPTGQEKTLSSNTVSHYHRLITSILAIAVQWQIILNNPCDRIKPPRVEKKDPRYLDEDQATSLLKLLEDVDTQHRVMIQLLLYTGIRRGELCGLEWPDIDFEHQIINIRRSSNYTATVGIYESSAKTLSSYRSIKVSESVIAILHKYKSWQATEKLKLGDLWIPSDRLFTKWNGAPYNPNTLTCWFAKFIKKHALPKISIHSLRHTNATLQIAGGVPLTTVAERLGHKTVAVTGSVYAHAIKSANAAAAETIDNLLNPAESRKKFG